jgi:CubicO group peptidase (beta-lactamase class C family)
MILDREAIEADPLRGPLSARTLRQLLAHTAGVRAVRRASDLLLRGGAGFADNYGQRPGPSSDAGRLF